MKIESDLHRGHQLMKNGERAVFPSSRGCQEPSRHLLLHHDGPARQPLPPVEQSPEQRRSDRVGEIADDPHGSGRFADQPIEIELERIAVDQLHVGGQDCLAAQRTHDPRVDLDGDHPPGAGREGPGQDAETGADLDDPVSRLRRRRSAPASRRCARRGESSGPDRAGPPGRGPRGRRAPRRPSIRPPPPAQRPSDSGTREKQVSCRPSRSPRRSRLRSRRRDHHRVVGAELGRRKEGPEPVLLGRRPPCCGAAAGWPPRRPPPPVDRSPPRRSARLAREISTSVAAASKEAAMSATARFVQRAGGSPPPAPRRS